MASSIGIGIVGSGFMGRTWSEVAANHTPGAHLAAVGGGGRAAGLAAEYGVPTYPVAELLRRPEIGAVVLATPPSTHVEYAIACAAAGKHLLIEKPMATTVADCDRITAAADRGGIKLAAVSQHRWRNSPRTAHDLVAAGRIGEVRMIRVIGPTAGWDAPGDAWKMDGAEQTPFAFDLGAVAIAGTELAKEEDKLIVGGFRDQGTSSGPLGDWGMPSDPFSAIVKAEAGLLQGGYVAPYALVLSPALYARLAGLIKDGQRELEMVEELVEGGIFQCTAMPDDQAMVLSLGAWNFDLVVGQDVVTAYTGNEGIDQKFRIFETLCLRIKRPGAICVLK